MVEKIYFFLLNKIRESYLITLMIFRIKIKKKKLALNWDMTTIVMKNADLKSHWQKYHDRNLKSTLQY